MHVILNSCKEIHRIDEYNKLVGSYVNYVNGSDFKDVDVYNCKREYFTVWI